MSDILYPDILYPIDIWYFVSYPIIGLMSDILYLSYYRFNVWYFVSYPSMFDDWYFVSYPIKCLMSDILYLILL